MKRAIKTQGVTDEDIKEIDKELQQIMRGISNEDDDEFNNKSNLVVQDNKNLTPIRTNSFSYNNHDNVWTRNNLVNIKEETERIRIYNNNYREKTTFYKNYKKEIKKMCIDQLQRDLNCKKAIFIPKEDVIPFELDRFKMPMALNELSNIIGDYYNINKDVILFVILHMISAAVHGGVEIHMEKLWKESMSNYGITIIPSGSKKTAIMGLLKKPFNDFIKNLIDNDKSNSITKEEINKALEKMKRQMINDKIKETKNNGEYEKDENMEEFKYSISRIVENTNKFKVDIKSKPEIFYSKITEEALFEAINSQGGHISFCDAENHFFKSNIMKNRSSILLSVHDNEDIYYDTKTSGKFSIEKPSITIMQMIQPDIASAFYHDIKYSDERVGFTERFIPCYGSSYFNGQLKLWSPNEKMVIRALKEKYDNRIMSLLARYFNQNVNTEKKVLKKSQKSKELVEFEMEINKKIDSRHYDYMEKYLRKAVGQAVRYAGAIHAFNHAFEPIEDSELSDEELAGGIELMKKLIPHAEYTFDQKMLKNRQNAIKIIDRILNSRMNTYEYILDSRLITQMTHLGKEEQLDAFKILEEHNLCQIYVEKHKTFDIILHKNFYELFRGRPEWCQA